MGRKRKNEAVTRLDEADRTLYTAFRGAANALSQLYTQSMTQQKLSFQAGERHSMDKLYHWIVRQHEEGSRVTVSDILSHIQIVLPVPVLINMGPVLTSKSGPAPDRTSMHEMEYGSGEGPVSPRLHSQAAVQFVNPSSNSPQSNLFSQPRLNVSEQSRNVVFSNALSSPVRRTLQSYHISQGDGYCSNSDSQPTAGGQNNSSSCNDSSMDMVSDSPFR